MANMPSPAAHDRVVVVHVHPSVAVERLVPATFAAAAAAFGSPAICDVAHGPRGSVLVHVAGAPATPSMAAGLRDELLRRLAGDSDGTLRVDVEELATQDGSAGVVREMALEWIQRAGPDSFLSSQGNAYDAAIRELLDGGQVRMVFQPIVEAWSGRVIGFEALCRGPVGHLLEMPDAFFDALGRSTLQRETHLRLADLARRRAAAVLPSKELLLFINAPSEDHWPTPTQGGPPLLSTDSWPWPQVVLEVTEKSPVRNTAAFAAVVEWGRASGARFALDDVGAGYAGLSAYAQLQPEFTKIDMGLVRGCESDPTRRAIIASLVALAHRTGSRVVAEGVETTAELDTVRWLGVDYVQGFLVARPDETPTALHHPLLMSGARRRGTVRSTSKANATS